MSKKTQRLHQFAKLPLAVAVAASMSTPASAFQFYMGDMEASFDTTLSAGASWRMAGRDDYLVGTGNLGDGYSINTDDGNLNFDKHDTYSKIVKGNSDFLVTYEDWGVFARAKYWYDFELKDESRATDGNGYTRELSRDGKANASGAELLDAYIWRDFWFGDTPLNLRLGKQVVSWGESTFIFNGINVINPVDIGAIRAPGAQIKEALLPVNMLYGSLGLTDDITLEAFIQLSHENSRIDDCGTFFSTVDYVADGCGDNSPVSLINGLSEQTNQETFSQMARLPDQQADDTDQFGVALRWFAADWNETEFGLYFLQYHSRLPLVGGQVATDTDNDGVISSAEKFTTTAYQIQYPEKIQMLGLSFNTTGPGGISLGGEYSFKHDMPLQFNSIDLVLGAAGDTVSPLFQNRVPDTDNDGTSTIAEAKAAGFLGSTQQGYDQYDVSQIQMTAIKFVDQIMGASRLTFVGEVGATYVHDLPDVDEIRYGRSDQLGFGLTDAGLAACEAANALSAGWVCDKEGYTTSFSWGYRMRTSLLYNDVFAGVNLTPQLALSHDVKGFAPGPGANFVEGRKSVGLSVRADYLNQYSATMAYTNYFGGGRHNTISDRDNLALSVSYSF